MDTNDSEGPRPIFWRKGMLGGIFLGGGCALTGYGVFSASCGNVIGMAEMVFGIFCSLYGFFLISTIFESISIGTAREQTDNAEDSSSPFYFELDPMFRPLPPIPSDADRNFEHHPSRETNSRIVPAIHRPYNPNVRDRV